MASWTFPPGLRTCALPPQRRPTAFPMVKAIGDLCPRLPSLLDLANGRCLNSAVLHLVAGSSSQGRLAHWLPWVQAHVNCFPRLSGGDI